MTNPIDINSFLMQWVASQLAESGITNHADYAGMHITLRPTRGLQINYFDQNGNQIVGYSKVRLHPDDLTTTNDGAYGGQILSKYLSKRGQPQLLYWPRVLGVDHNANLSDINCPIFIVEGEKKALKLQIELLSLGVQGSAVGVPGVKLTDEIYKSLTSLAWHVKANGEIIRRTAWLVFDWNDPNALAERDTRACEMRVFQELYGAGAMCVGLRWSPTEGTQKIDDWLAAGGDLKGAMSDSAANNILAQDELTAQLMAFNDQYAAMKGRYVIVKGDDLGEILTAHDFHEMNKPHTIWMNTGKRPKKEYVSKLWAEWQFRNAVTGLESEPPPLGQAPTQYLGTKLNICRGWGKIPLPPPWEDDLPSTELIDTLLSNFCESERHFLWLRQHIAHMLRYPGVRTSQVVLLGGVPGVGKSMLIESFIRLGGGQGGIVNEIAIDSKDEFNLEMRGAVIGYCEEPMRWTKKDMESFLKRLTGNDYIRIRQMQRDAYLVKNNLHLFITMNFDYLAHVGPDDRRCNFFKGKERIGAEGNGFALTYAEFMKSDYFAATWVRWAEGVDLTGYNPQVLGPVSEARVLAIGMSSNQEEIFFQSDELQAKEVWSNDQLRALWLELNPDAKDIPNRLWKMMHKHGYFMKPHDVGGVTKKFHAKAGVGWEGKSKEEWLLEAGVKNPKYAN